MSKQLRIAGDPGTLKPIIEALIFASEEPLPARTLVRIISGEEISGRPAQETAEAAADEQLPLAPESSADVDDTGVGASDKGAAIESVGDEATTDASADAAVESGDAEGVVAENAAAEGAADENIAGNGAASDERSADESVAGESADAGTDPVAGNAVDDASAETEPARDESAAPADDAGVQNDAASEDATQADGNSTTDRDDSRSDGIAGERIDLALSVTTTSQLVVTVEEMVEEGAAREPEVAETGDLVETPEQPAAEETVSAETSPDGNEADVAVSDDAPAGELPADESAVSGADAPDADAAATPEEASTDAASGEGAGADLNMSDAETMSADEAATPDADAAPVAAEADEAGSGDADAPTEADLLATTDPVTLDAEPPVDLASAEQETAEDTKGPDASDEEPEALQEAMERAEARVSGRGSDWLAGTSIDQRYVRILIEELNQEYDESGRAFRIVEVAGGFQFATTRDFGEYVALLSKEKMRRRLSPAALETLAIIAYRQPVSKPEIEAIRGVNCDQVLLNLMEKNLISITGRSEGVGRPLLYGTTDEFLRIFGINSVGDLPKLRELEELMEENVLSPERAEVVTVDENSDVEEIEAKVGAAGHHDEAQLPIDEFAAQPAGEDVQPDTGDEAGDDVIAGEAEEAAADETGADETADAATGNDEMSDDEMSGDENDGREV